MILYSVDTDFVDTDVVGTRSATDPQKECEDYREASAGVNSWIVVFGRNDRVLWWVPKLGVVSFRDREKAGSSTTLASLRSGRNDRFLCFASLRVSGTILSVVPSKRAAAAAAEASAGEPASASTAPAKPRAAGTRARR